MEIPLRHQRFVSTQRQALRLRRKPIFPIPISARQFLIPITFAALIVTAFGQQSRLVAPDMILLNGKVFTSNAKTPHAEAMAIRGERIAAVGTSREMVKLAGKKTKVINLNGRTVIPGINDAHMHLGVRPDTYDLPMEGNNPDFQQLKDALAMALTRAPKGTWIEGTFGPAVLDDPQATRAVLDRLAPDHPVALWDWTAHASLLNTSAMRRLGIHEDEPNPRGGMYVRDKSDGKLTGMVLEFAEFQVSHTFSDLATQQQAIKQLSHFFGEEAQLGITTNQDMANPLTADRAAALFEKAPPPIRVRVIWFGLTDSHGRLPHVGRRLPLHPSPLVTVTGTKWILDGTPIERSAGMRVPYRDRPATSGELDFSEKEMEQILREALHNNNQLMVHIVGDRTTEAFLNAMDATGGEKVWSGRRVRVEHGDGIMPDLVPRAKRLGVIVVVNPTHFTLGDVMVQRYGDKRAREIQPLRSLLDSGIPVAIGSDGPDNPFLNIMLASTYPGKPQEALTREQAVVAYTLGSAYAEFTEKDKGSLEPGKLADLAVLSQDIFAIPAGDLPKTQSVLTLVGGKVIYDGNVLGAH
jgi:predicted amidohydrolase YtcJ